MLPYLFTPECWERSMHYSTSACIYQADSQLETSCTHEGGTRGRNTSLPAGRVNRWEIALHALPPSLSLISILEQVDCRCLWIRPPYTGFSSPLGLRAISQQRFAALSRITGSRHFPFVEWMERVATPPCPSSSPLLRLLRRLFSRILSPGLWSFFFSSSYEKVEKRSKVKEIEIICFLKLKSYFYFEITGFLRVRLLGEWKENRYTKRKACSEWYEARIREKGRVERAVGWTRSTSFHKASRRKCKIVLSPPRKWHLFPGSGVDGAGGS